MDNNTINATVKALADELLAAQVEEARSRLLDDRLVDLAAAELDMLMAQADEIPLGEVVSRQALKDVVRVFAFELNLGAGVIALAGDMAQQLHRTAQKDAPKLKELLSNNSASQWLNKIVELGEFRRLILDKIGHSVTLHQFVADHVLILIEQQITQRSPNWLQELTSNVDIENQQGLRGRLKSNVRQKLNSRVRQQEELLERTLRQAVAKTIKKSCSDLAQLDESVWHDAIWQLWQVVRDESVSEFTKGLDPLDIEEFLVLGYNEWRKIRQTEYIQRLINTGIDVFYNAYEDVPLTEVLEDVGVTRNHMLAEISRFAPPVIQVLDEHGYIREILTRQFKPFYENPTTLAILQRAIKHT
ncbi:hypothetical protein [Aquirhabdus parva]|uniref:Uncharacterized protein n=1 Tax=Aquirhabdus parva TaxID=2283318 RepID=A0A345P4D1_9GAMM|nr:hypothetical protein [Aquirhabdus parva]AXI02140.1 hypothetical protein HYN46_04285 [Aquirhabdus parva]